MKTFTEFNDTRCELNEEQLQYLEEKLLVIGGGKRYGQVVFLAGGAGSGKGFAAKNFMESDKFKVRDVDEMKLLFLKINKRKGLYPEVAKLNLKTPEDVRKLHAFVDKMDVKDKTLVNLLRDTRPNKLPNIIFDITAKSVKSIAKVIPRLTSIGYNVRNINLVWVLTKYHVAVEANATRARVVPSDIMLQTHEGAANTIYDVVTKNAIPRSLMDGGIYVILNNRENTVFFTTGDTKATRKSGKKEAGKTLKNTRQVIKGDRKAKAIIKDFTYLVIKKPGGTVSSEKSVLDQLFKWIVDNIPATKETKGIFSKHAPEHVGRDDEE